MTTNTHNKFNYYYLVRYSQDNHTFFDIALPEKYLSIKVLTDILSSSYGKAGLHRSALDAMRDGTEFDFMTNADERVTVDGNKTMIRYYPKNLISDPGYTYNSSDLLELVLGYEKNYYEYVVAQQKNKKWHGIPTDPEYFKENNIEAMYYDPGSGKIGEYDLKNNIVIE